MPAIPALRQVRQEYQASLSYVVSVRPAIWSFATIFFLSKKQTNKTPKNKTQQQSKPQTQTGKYKLEREVDSFLWKVSEIFPVVDRRARPARSVLPFQDPSPRGNWKVQSTPLMHLPCPIKCADGHFGSRPEEVREPVNCLRARSPGWRIEVCGTTWKMAPHQVSHVKSAFLSLYPVTVRTSSPCS